MKQVCKVLIAGGLILLTGTLYAHVTIQKGPQMPTSTSTLQSDFGRDHVDLEPTIMGVRLTKAGLDYLSSLINDVLQDPKLLEYVDCMVKGMLDADTGNGTDEVKWDSNTNTCDDSKYDPGVLLPPTCLSVPIVGTFCLMLVVMDDPADSDNFIIEWHYKSGDTNNLNNFPRVELVGNPRENKIVRYPGENDPSHDYDDSLDLRIYIADITLDAVFTNPATGYKDANGNFHTLTPQYSPATSDTCSSTLGPACLGDATCGETDAGDYYDPATDISNYVTVWANLIIGCHDPEGDATDPAGDLAEQVCPGIQAPLILSTSIRAGLSYDDKTHINYSAANGAADSGAWCDPDRDPNGNVSGGLGCHLKTLDVNIAGLDLYANVYFQFDRNTNRVCSTCPSVFGDRVGDGLTEFTGNPGPSNCCGTSPNTCSGLTTEQKAFCDRNGNNLCNDPYDDPNYNPTQQVAGLLPFLEAQVMAKLQDVFTCNCQYGTFPGGSDGNICTPDANECVNPATGLSRAGTNPACGDEDYPPTDPGCVGYYLASTLRLNLSPTLDTLSFDHPLTPATDPIYIDAGVRTDMWAEPDQGILIPGDLGLDLYWTYNAGTSSAPDLEPMTSCVTLQVDGPAPQYSGPITPVVSQVCYDTRYYNLPGYTCTVTEMVYGVGNQDDVFNSDQAIAEFKPINVNGTYGTATYTYHLGLGIHHNFFSRAITSVIKSGVLCLTVNKDTPMIGGLVGGILNTGTFGLLMPKLAEIYGDDNDMEIRLVPSFKRPEPADYDTDFETAFPPATTGPITPFSNKIADVPFILTGGYTLAALNPAYPNFPTAITTSTADLTVGIPHLRIDFHVVDDAGNAQRAFGLDFGMLLGVDLELLRNDAAFNDGQPRKFPGDIELTTGRILHAGVTLSSAVNYYLEYYEALTGLGRQDLNSILSNLIPTILSMAIGLTADIGIDLGAVLPVPLTVKTVDTCTGPTNNTTCPAATIMPYGPNRPFMPDSAITWDTPLYMLSGANAGTITIKATDFNLINPSDWLGIFLTLEGRLNALAVIELLEGGLLSGLMGGLGLSPSASAGWDGFNPPETIIIPSEKLTAMDAGFTFDAYDDVDTGNTVRYAWRLDKGFWTPFTNIRNISFSHLYEGTHILEVRAVDSEKNMDPTPAVYTFRIDSLGPSIRIHGAGDMNIVATSSPTFYIEARDAQAPDELVTISYRVDGSDWTPFTSARTITLSGLEEGLHRLEVRAKDDVGNISTASMVFKVSTGAAGFGCSVVKSSGPGLGIILLFVPLLFRRRS